MHFMLFQNKNVNNVNDYNYITNIYTYIHKVQVIKTSVIILTSAFKKSATERDNKTNRIPQSYYSFL